MKKKSYILFLLMVISIGSCDLPQDDVTQATSMANLITRFRVYKNTNEYFDATISQNDTTIVLELPDAMPLTELYPEIIISKNASVTPASGEKMDFSSTVNYSVLAEDKVSLRVYKVSVIHSK